MQTAECWPQSYKPAFRQRLPAQTGLLEMAPVTKGFAKAVADAEALSAVKAIKTTEDEASTAVYGFQVSVGQFKFPDRVLWEAEEFLFAQALPILCVFPCACNIELHLGFPFSTWR
jgi:hypothetical protein